MKTTNKKEKLRIKVKPQSIVKVWKILTENGFDKFMIDADDGYLYIEYYPEKENKSNFPWDDIELSPVQNLMDYAMKSDVNSAIDMPKVKSKLDEFMKELENSYSYTDRILGDDEDLTSLIFGDKTQKDNGDKTSLYDRLKKK